MTSDTVITYDANGDIKDSTDDQETGQQTFTVIVGSEPPYDGDAIVDAVYDDTIDTLEIMLGDPDATDAVVGNIFVDSVALTNGVTFTPEDSTTDPSSPVPAKITVTGLGTAPQALPMTLMVICLQLMIRRLSMLPWVHSLKKMSSSLQPGLVAEAVTSTS